jgi:hypothetical protein
MTTDAQRLAAIDLKIDALLTTPEVDYTDGDVSVKAGQKIQQLLDARKEILAHPTPDIALMVFDNPVDEFGNDTTETL